jgi:alpha-amylase/alpha-mannosidase (GH57 family)
MAPFHSAIPTVGSDPLLNPELGDRATATGIDPHAQANGVYIAIHGHFYQPPRESPYLETIERQASAAPFHNWNDRIHSECYRPNAFARILNDRGEVIDIVNNYEYLSFNFGSTLLSWLERHDIETYQRILEADRASCLRLQGHGNAIAQVYNHIILPLATDRDKRTQIRWGKADFHSRFGREPEGMWLAETAVDRATLIALADEGIAFTIVAPSQVQRCRPLPTAEHPYPDWSEVGGGQIDPTRPYRCFLPELGADRYIDIFVYDGPISRGMGFEDVLTNSEHLAGRLGQAVRGDHRPSQLIAVATDGETFGHHKGGTEKCLAYAFTREFPQRGWTVTNFAHYLALCPPTWELELKPVTAWSCSHGVDRWQEDCGCGGGGGWHQQWRRPLRQALDWLRDRLIPMYEEAASPLLRSPWDARDEYIQVVRDRSAASVNDFFQRHQTHELTASERVTVLKLLEMQRHALLMYTSCGWFFEELSRPEGVQILRYAGRAIELAAEVTKIQLEPSFVQRLALAPSNLDFFVNGATVYKQLITTAQISLEQVAAHYAMASLFSTATRDEQIYCYTVRQPDYYLQRLGTLTLAIGQIQLISEVTEEQRHLVFAVLHMGGWDFHCSIQPFGGEQAYAQTKETLLASFQYGSAAQVLLVMNQMANARFYSLENLFAEERHRLMRLLTYGTLTRLDQLYTQVYRDNYSVLLAFHRDGLPVPPELQVAAEVALNHRMMVALQALEQELGNETAEVLEAGRRPLAELEAIAIEAGHLHCRLHRPEGQQILERLLWQCLRQMLYTFEPTRLAMDSYRLRQLLQLGQQLGLHLSLARAQELYYTRLCHWLIPQCQQPPASSSLSPQQLRQLLEVGKLLAIDTESWLAMLPAPKEALQPS